MSIKSASRVFLEEEVSNNHSPKLQEISLPELDSATALFQRTYRDRLIFNSELPLDPVELAEAGNYQGFRKAFEVSLKNLVEEIGDDDILDGVELDALCDYLYGRIRELSKEVS